MPPQSCHRSRCCIRGGFESRAGWSDLVHSSAQHETSWPARYASARMESSRKPCNQVYESLPVCRVPPDHGANTLRAASTRFVNLETFASACTTSFDSSTPQDCAQNHHAGLMRELGRSAHLLDCVRYAVRLIRVPDHKVVVVESIVLWCARRITERRPRHRSRIVGEAGADDLEQGAMKRGP